MAAKKIGKTFVEQFEIAAKRSGEAAVRAQLDILKAAAEENNRSAWAVAKAAFALKDEFGFSLTNLKEFLGKSTPRLSEFVNTYETFKGTEIPAAVSFDLANVARKAHLGFHGEAKQRFTPMDVLQSFQERHLTARKARAEIASQMRRRNLEASLLAATEIAAHHPDLLTLCHQLDCRSVASLLPERSVNLIFADPPYLGYKRMGVRTYTTGHEDTAGLEADADSLDPAEALRLYLDLIQLAPAVLAENGVMALFLSATMHTDLDALVQIYTAVKLCGLRIAHDLTWVKNKMPPKNFEAPFSTQTERIWLICREGEMVVDHFDYTRQTVPYLPNQKNTRSDLVFCDTETGRFLAARRSGAWHNPVVHQFEKPVELGMYLAEKLTLPGHLVWDACGCHANLTLAAIRLGRRFVYSESHPDRYAEGLRRIHAEQVETGKGCLGVPSHEEVAHQGLETVAA